MVRWGLRMIFCWLSVLVTACAQLASPTPAQKTQNRTPIEGYTPPPTTSPTAPIRPAYTLTPLSSLTVISKADLNLAFPACYETPAQSLVCLGWLSNESNARLTNVIIHVVLLNSQGFPIAVLEATPLFEVLLPNAISPYRVIFQQVPTESWGIYAEIRQGRRVRSAVGPQVTALQVQNLEIRWASIAYEVSGEISNFYDGLVHKLRVVAMIWEDSQTVSGFRVLDFETVLRTNETLAFQITVAPLNHQPGAKVSVLAQATILN